MRGELLEINSEPGEAARFMAISGSEYELNDPPVTTRNPPPSRSSSAAPAREPRPRRSWSPWLFSLAIVGLCLGHAWLIWVSIGGWEGLTSEWPLLQADHGIHFRHGILMGHFLRTTGMTAGYDPDFMSGYPMSIVSDLSSTFSTLVMMTSIDRPAMAYKFHVFGCCVAVPWLIALACVAWRVKPAGILVAVGLDLAYFWTDFPMKYAGLGMLNYLLSVPIALICLAGLTSYFERGGFARWLWACTSATAVFLVHLTSPMLLGPAGLLAYGVAIVIARRSGATFTVSRHVGLWLMPPIILLTNSFWLWPGFLLRGTKGGSEGSFSHPEPLQKRLKEIFWEEMPIEGALVGLALVGIVVLIRKRPIVAAGLGGFLAAGFGWGYLAGPFRALDTFQPGRHTYAFYSAAAIVSGMGLVEVLDRLRPVKLGRWFMLALVLMNVRAYGPIFEMVWKTNVFSKQPFLSSRPTTRISFVVQSIKEHMKPGERLFFEETGLAIPGVPEPYEMRHCSAILPMMTGVEVIGGPYLHSTVTTNFTQFGENKLCEKANWNLEQFTRYAKLYRPSAICCWTSKARTFCISNPDLIQIVADDGIVLVGRVVGFGGASIRGKATVEAGPNRLVIRDAVADETAVDGLVVLRYHAVPYLKATPPLEIVPVLLEDDPVPFIGLRPTLGPVTIEMRLPPGR